MTVRRLEASRVDRLRVAPFTHPPTLGPVPAVPEGLGELRMSRVLGRRGLDAVAADLLAWRAHEGAGLTVHASDVPLVTGTVVETRLGVGALAARFPCRVVDVFEEPDLRGFSYATLPGHPELGQEWFVLTEDAAGRVTFTVTAASRPGTLLARVGGPVTHRAQRLVNRRYLAALDRLGRVAGA